MPYICWNSPMVTTSPMAKVTTGTVTKTMLQLATPSTRMIRLISWGYELDAVPGSTGGVIELLQTDVGATITPHVASGIQPLDPNGTASQLLISTTTQTGYTATLENTTTASRSFDTNLVPPTAGAASVSYDQQWMPEEQPVVAISKFLRVRATMSAAVNMLCYVVFTEVG